MLHPGVTTTTAQENRSWCQIRKADNESTLVTYASTKAETKPWPVQEKYPVTYKKGGNTYFISFISYQPFTYSWTATQIIRPSRVTRLLKTIPPRIVDNVHYDVIPKRTLPSLFFLYRGPESRADSLILLYSNKTPFVLNKHRRNAGHIVYTQHASRRKFMACHKVN